jgi:hypothetical protein
MDLDAKPEVPAAINTRPKTPLILYFVSLLSFIPLIGFFVGIAVAAFGIFKYRNWIIVCIGLAGMVFTFGMYGYLFHSMKTGGQFDQSKIELAKLNLNSLVEDIEIYKVQYGSYPHDLKELQKVNGLSFVNDPITMGDDKPFDTYFYYEPTDSNYHLFSSGFDRKPFTPDDIYPTVDDPRHAFRFIRK